MTAAEPRFDALDASPARRRLPARLSGAAAIWGLGYAVYRGYHAAGGTIGIPGMALAGTGTIVIAGGMPEPLPEATSLSLARPGFER